jgi:hypothetical protein
MAARTAVRIVDELRGRSVLDRSGWATVCRGGRAAVTRGRSSAKAMSRPQVSRCGGRSFGVR